MPRTCSQGPLKFPGMGCNSQDKRLAERSKAQEPRELGRTQGGVGLVLHQGSRLAASRISRKPWAPSHPSPGLPAHVPLRRRVSHTACDSSYGSHQQMQACARASHGLAPVQAAAPGRLQGQRCALPHCTLGPGAPLSAAAASLPEPHWPRPRRRGSLTPGSRPWALGGPLGCRKQAGIPAEETPQPVSHPARVFSRALPTRLEHCLLPSSWGLLSLKIKGLQGRKRAAGRLLASLA